MQGVATERTLDPRHQIAFPGTEYILGVQFSPDGRTAYCLVDGQSVDLWAAGMSWWPELLGGVCTAALLLYVLLIVRTRRRPQNPGDPHCRRCNYNVIAQAPDAAKPRATRRRPDRGTLCPECGADLSRKRPRRGRSTRRRLAAPTILLALLIASYSSLFLLQVPRGVVTPESPWLTSAWADTLVEKYKPAWLLAYRTRCCRIMTVDTKSGRISGSLRSMRAYVQGGMRISPDGRYLAVGEGASRLCWISTTSGRCVASVVEGEFRSGDRGEFLVGFDGPADDPWVYFAAVDQPRSVSRLVKWRPRTGERRTVVEEPAYVMTYSNGAKAALARRYGLLHRKDGVATASGPDFMQAYQEKSYAITIRAPEDTGGAVERTIRVTDTFVESTPFLTSPDGSTIYLIAGTTGVVSYDTSTGARLHSLRPSIREIPQRGAALSSDGEWIAISVFKQSVLVYDIQRRRWLARLNYPAPFIAPAVIVSPDRRWIAATPFRATAGPPAKGPYVHELFLFDLSTP